MTVLQEFIKRLHNDLTNIGADYELGTDIDKFVVWVGWKLFQYDPQKVIENLLIYSDGNRIALTGEFDENIDKAIIITFYFSDHNDIHRINDSEINSILNSWPNLRNHRLRPSDAGEVFLQELEDKGVGWDLVNYIITDGEFPPEMLNTTTDNIHIIDIQRLRQEYVRAQHPLYVNEPLSLTLKLRGNQVLNYLPMNSTLNIPAIVCALPLEKIYGWVTEYGNGLFAQNLRLRLSGYDRVAMELEQQIRETIRTAPEHMFILNNGITITCSKIEPNLTQLSKDLASEINISLSNPQIINGCQTSWAIHTFFENSTSQGIELPSGYVLAKIVETKNEGLKEEITRSSNRQNAITPQDQRSVDEWQPAISERLTNYTEDLGIFWDYRRGGWEHIENINESWRYQVKGRSYRKIDSQLAGQVILSMAGAVHEAKNQGGKIHLIESLYRFAFRYDLPPDERFSDLSDPKLRSGGALPLDTFVEDLLFGFAIHQYALAAFQTLYTGQSKQLKTTSENNSSALESLSKKEFVKYWHFDVVHLVHLIVEEWVSTERITRKELRRNLVGDLTRDTYLNNLFISHSKRSQMFNLEKDVNKTSILDITTPSSQLPLLGLWFKNLQEEIGAEVISRIVNREPDISSFNFILKRATTHEEFIKQLDGLLHGGKSTWTQLFPSSPNRLF